MRFVLPLLLAAIGFAQEFVVRETAGLRRFSYPVRAVLTPAPTGTLVLLEDGKPVPAQFTPRSPNGMEIDFVVSLSPNESHVFRVETGNAPAPSSSMQCEDSAESFIARQPGGLAFIIPKNLTGLLSQASSGKLQYVRPGSPGLVIITRDGRTRQAEAHSKAGIYKSGPFACGFRFESPGKSPGSFVEIEVPRTKSWMEVRWTNEDSDTRIACLGVDLNLAIEPPRTLVDFGAGSYVYVALRPGEDTRLRAAKSKWQIDVAGQPYAAGQSSVEGWAHVMDATRATAASVEDFGRSDAEDEISVQAEGRLVIRRSVLNSTKKHVHFWLHFVSMPVQVGAATSPQSMMAPLAVEWK